MRTVLNIDDDLVTTAIKLTGITEKTALLNAGLKALIERESSKRLAQLGGSEQHIACATRRQSHLN